MTKSYILLKYLVLTCLLMGAFPATATCTTHISLLEPASLISGNGYQLAKTWFLPDWQSNTRSYNTSSDSDDKGGGDSFNPGDNTDRCSIYGFQAPDAVDASLYTCTTVYPVTGLTCYDNCACKSDFKYTTANCSAGAGKKLSGRSCGGKYENCVCKPTVTVSTGEKCDLYCENACVEKSCKPSVNLGTGEECSERCASNTGICTATKCKASVSYDTSKGEYCAEKCASNSSVCTKKGCNKICKDTFTGSAPANGYITTQSCSDCSGSYTIKTGWACNNGYHAAGNSCIADCTRSCYDKFTGSAPANASFTTEICSDCSGSYTIKTGWACNSGYTKSGSGCVCATTCSDKITTKPANSSYTTSICTACGVSKTINTGWICNSGYANTDSYWCSKPQTTDCSTLGYNKTDSACTDKSKILCPFDNSKFACF